MSKDAFTLTNPDGSSLELPVHKGTVGPDVVDIGRDWRTAADFDVCGDRHLVPAHQVEIPLGRRERGESPIERSDAPP